MRSNRLLYVGLRAADVCLRVLPYRFLYVLIGSGGWLAYFLAPGARSALLDNLSVVLGLPHSARRTRRAARNVFRNDALNWLDTLRIARVSQSELERMVQVNGWERLESAARAGRGVILVALHLGNFDFVGNLLPAHGYRLTIPVEDMKPPELLRFLLERRTRNGIDAVPLEYAPRRMIMALRRGQLVATAGDRNLAGRTERVSFFRRTTELPRGVASLHARSGAPVLIAFALRQGCNRYEGFISSPLDLLPGSSPEIEAENVQRLALAMEPYVYRHADQWLMFRRVWEGNVIARQADSMDQHSQVAV